MGPGRLLGEGRTAEVREYGTDKVVKLLRLEFDPELLDGERATHRAAVQAGSPAPGIHGEVSIGGRRTVIGIAGTQDDDVERWMIPFLAGRLAEEIEWSVNQSRSGSSR